MLYFISLFLHVTGALLYSASLAIEWLSFTKLKKADSSDKFNDWLSIYSSLHMLSGIAWVLILFPGIYLMVFVWHNIAWANIALAGFLLLAIVGSMITGMRMKPIKNEMKNNGFSEDIKNKLNDQMLNFSLKARTTLTIGIVFLMTIKPGLSDSIMTLVIALLLGFWPVNQSKTEKALS
jgi:undecaprenyl pyrophosphate phosphatase UppP